MTHPIDTSPTPTPTHGWTPERKVQFLDRLAVHGNARAACRSVGLSAEAAYRLRRRDPLFARGWDAAVVLGRENGVQVLGDRAIEGIEEDIYFRGEVVGTRRRYDNRLLLAHLARLDQLAKEGTASEDAGRFDDLLACIAEGSGGEPLPDRAACIAQASVAVEEYRRRMLKPHDDAVKGTTGVNGARAHAEQRRAQVVAELDRECDARAAQAREEAAEAWDRRRTGATAIVDALCATPDATAPNTAALTAVPVVVPTAGAVCLPRTLSTVSTSALAAAIARPFASPPRSPGASRSPFSAPRRLALT